MTFFVFEKMVLKCYIASVCQLVQDWEYIPNGVSHTEDTNLAP